MTTSLSSSATVHSVNEYMTAINSVTITTTPNITYRIRMNADNNVITQLMSLLQKVDVTDV